MLLKYCPLKQACICLWGDQQVLIIGEQHWNGRVRYNPVMVSEVCAAYA